MADINVRKVLIEFTLGTCKDMINEGVRPLWNHDLSSMFFFRSNFLLMSYVSSHASSFQDGEMIEDDEFADFEKHDNVT